MKTFTTPWRWALVFFFAQAITATATTFNTDTFIGVNNLADDGQDIIVTNCTLTVDGPHGFNSLRVLNGGVVTHSPFLYGPEEITFSVVNEAQVLSATNPATLDNTNVDTSAIMVTDLSSSTLYTEDVDYVVIASNQFIQLELTTNSAIADGAPVLVSYDWAQTFQGVTLTISNNVNVASGGAINLSGKGYAGGNGFGSGAGTSLATNYPFTFTAGGGGAHGGFGGMSSSFARGGASYDSAVIPNDLGSGGGTGSNLGGAGGGLAQLSIGGTLQLDGQILADGLKGTNAHSGGGAGGSLLLSMQTLSGAGTISARGGGGDTPDGGGGSGGRIAIYFATNNFTGGVLAFGGAGANYGGAGTIFIQSDSNAAGQLVIANGGTRGTNTSFSVANVTNLVISGGAIAQGQLASFAVSNLFVGSNSSLIEPYSTTLTLTVNGDATVESNAAISGDFKSPSGPGAGGPLLPVGPESGGGYGGYGGASASGIAGGGFYGSIAQPSTLGSPGGGGGLGGGAIKMTVAGTLSLDGKVSANGASGTIGIGGGGSGGSVLLTVGNLLGSGTISANGGPANNLGGGGGGGGRIAVYSGTNLFAGSITAVGGSGTNAGGPGTVYVDTNASAFAQLTIDNGGLTGFTALPSALTLVDLTLSGHAVVTNFDGSIAALRTLFIASNSWFTLSSSSSATMNINATNATIQPGGGILLDGESTSLNGSGQSLNGTGGGGGNGGLGGASGTNAPGGFALGVVTLATAPGGIGGNGLNGAGGNGGAALVLNVANNLQLDGSISANGVTGPGINSGGGAGGSVALTMGTFAGAGSISVNGGAGNDSLGGGGAGGRVAILSNTNLFSGIITGHGGAGANFGGAGTIYLVQGKSQQKLIVDNGGTRGAITPLSTALATFDLTVTGGGILSNGVSSSVSLGNLLIGSNSAFLAAPFSQDQLTVLTNATIQLGGALSFDGATATGSGIGQTLNSTGGGGTYGGIGGASISNALGGPAVLSDSVILPTLFGSRGGAGLNSGAGGNGGGSLQIVVDGKLQLDGKISAEGVTGPGLNSGGGSGGSIKLSAKTISGAGVVSVNGGSANTLGGGGGGGRLALYYATNSFTGTLTAHGGAGANYGGAGTIFANSSFTGGGLSSQFTVDNGGATGNTILSAYPSGFFNFTVTGAAIVNNTNSQSLTVQNFLIGSNSTFVPFPLTLDTITVLTNATIQAGGRFSADGESITTASGGQTLNSTGGGGGHGGYGGESLSNALGGTVTLDQVSEPSSPGGRGGSGFAGTGGGNGGGAVHLTINGTLQLDGKISADGVVSPSFNGGGGAGGALWISTGKFQGAGGISASGGAGNNVGGGGGGGRIAISSHTNLFTGSLAARGGAGGNFGGAGTIYTSYNSGPTGGPEIMQLIVDNGGSRGTNTLLPILPTGVDVFLNSGAGATLSSGTVNWKSLTIASNATLSPLSGQGPIVVTLAISSNLTVQPGGTIAFNGCGFAANSGTAHGAAASASGGGGGHAGYGSQGFQIAATGGSNYDSIVFPAQSGSGGGSLASTSGSAGGGALQLRVTGALNVGGLITVNGAAANTPGAGGGSGGSLWLTVGTLSGAGKISADGGDGDVSTSGGGGGGCIAVYLNTNTFSGILSAHGGAGFAVSGGAGTLFVETNSVRAGQLVLDNAGSPGANTPIGSLTPSPGLSVQNGAAAISTVPLTLQNLSVGPGAFFDASPLSPLNLTVLGNVNIATNAGISADSAGYNPASGPGSGAVDFLGDGSGGGYGGVGGASLGAAPGGATYGSSNQPVDFGSPGGVSPVLAGFSQGGGTIRLQIGGALSLNGSISADGNDGIIDGSGGGSGGSIWITSHSISGNGFLTADGGMGESSEGGGGGGGRIAVNTGTNLFSGTILAAGGDGASPGQNGTAYISTNILISGSVTDTNGAAIGGITLQPSGIASVITDINGFYSVAVPVLWTGNVTPNGSAIIVPSLRTYSNVSIDTSNQNYLALSPSAFNFGSGQFDGTNVNFNWYGFNGVTYQPYSSSNLVDWVPYGSPFSGGNAPITLTLPPTNAPQMFFRLGVSY